MRERVAEILQTPPETMGKGVEAETGCQCNPNAFVDEDVVATVKAAGGEPAF